MSTPGNQWAGFDAACTAQQPELGSQTLERLVRCALVCVAVVLAGCLQDGVLSSPAARDGQQDAVLASTDMAITDAAITDAAITDAADQGTSGPDGAHEQGADGSGCAPDCTGKACGPDGCGGFCCGWRG